MTTFALLNGGGHGSWCWEAVIPELESMGHSSITPDMPVDDVAAGIVQWADVVVNALAHCHGEIVLVGHSMAGLALPVIASMRPLKHMVFLGALVPTPGKAFIDCMKTEPLPITFPFEQRVSFDTQGRSVIPWEAARNEFYGDCSTEVAEKAWKRFRPQAFTAFYEPCPLVNWPATPSTYILMREDRVVGYEWSRRIARERTGKEAIELPGSHSPFYSRPMALAKILAQQ